MLDLIGRKADGWIPSAGWAPPEELPGYLRRIEDAAAAAGRNPGSIRRIYNIGGSIGPTTDKPFGGPVGHWVEELSRVIEIGMDGLVFWPNGDDPVGQAEAFAGEVVPATRAAIGST
jgi:alkanesulfonate monooxygenase SsuD/methylene tetrahydromethanopterin reductase-like flavin-dependent oxidoreductase (luciferase family)